jgi:hypothetical protein
VVNTLFIEQDTLTHAYMVGANKGSALNTTFFFFSGAAGRCQEVTA